MKGKKAIRQKRNICNIMPSLLENFSFKARRQKLDYKKLAEINIDHIIDKILFKNELDTKQKELDDLTISKDTLEEFNRKLRAEVETLKKECKLIKRTLQAYEIKNSIPQTTAVANKSVEYHRCGLCPKAFSSSKYLWEHEKRRHPDAISKISSDGHQEAIKQDIKRGPSEELKKVTDLIESFSIKLLEKEKTEKEEQERRERKAKIDEWHLQERLRFENELQALKTAVHQELDEEKQALRDERKAFEILVSTQTKKLSHVGNILDDDEMNDSIQSIIIEDVSESSFRDDRRKKGIKIQSEKKKDAEAVQATLQMQNNLRNQIFSEIKCEFDARLKDIGSKLESEHKSEKKTLEEKLEFALNELNKIKSNVRLIEKSESMGKIKIESPRLSKFLPENSKTTYASLTSPINQIIIEDVQQLKKESSFIENKAEVFKLVESRKSSNIENFIPNVQKASPVPHKLEKQPSYMRNMNITWELCLALLEKQTNINNLTPLSFSLFEHLPQQIENQRIEIQNLLDSQLLEFGISKQNVLDFNMSSCCKNFEAKMLAAEKMKMENDSLHTTMKDFIKAQLDSLSGLQMSQKSLPPLPRKSSFSKKTNPPAPPKSVKIKEKSKEQPKKLHIKVPKKTNIFHSKSGFGFKSAEDSPQFFIPKSIESTPYTPYFHSPAGVSDYTRSPDSLEEKTDPIPRKKSILKSISMVKNALGIKSAKPSATPKFSNPINPSKNPPQRRPPIEPPKISREEEESTSFSGNLNESFTATTYDSDEDTDLEDLELRNLKSEIQPSDLKQEKNNHIEDIVQEQEISLNTAIKHNNLHNSNIKEDDIHIEEIVQDFVSEEESTENINNTLTSLSPIRNALGEEFTRDEQIIQNTDDINEFDSESLSLTDISNSIREKPSPPSPGADILHDLSSSESLDEDLIKALDKMEEQITEAPFLEQAELKYEQQKDPDTVPPTQNRVNDILILDDIEDFDD